MRTPVLIAIVMILAGTQTTLSDSLDTRVGMKYLFQKKELGAGLALSFLPVGGVGHLYAENLALGVSFLAVETFFIVVAVNSSDKVSLYGFLITKILDIALTPYSVRLYNESLFRKLSLKSRPGGLSLLYTF